jgi:PKD repeat protein
LLNVYAKTSSNLSITNLHWDFGDGSTLDIPYSAHSYVSEMRFHIYQSTGTFTVTVTSYDSGGNSQTANVILTNVTPGSCTAPI